MLFPAGRQQSELFALPCTQHRCNSATVARLLSECAVVPNVSSAFSLSLLSPLNEWVGQCASRDPLVTASVRMRGTSVFAAFIWDTTHFCLQPSKNASESGTDEKNLITLP